MLRTIRKLLGEKSKQIKFPIALMGADAVLSIVLYVVLYMTVIQLLSNTLTAGKIVTYTAICFISVIARLVIYRSAYYLCFARGAEMCGEMRLDLANHYRSLSLGYFNQNSSGYLLGTLTKDLTNFELVIHDYLLYLPTCDYTYTPVHCKDRSNGGSGADRNILY